MAFELNQFKTSIFEYVESRMTYIAPNLSAIVGASTAAKMMGKRLFTFLPFEICKKIEWKVEFHVKVSIE